MNFATSTHKSNWLFSEEALRDRRHVINAKVRAQALQNKPQGAADPPPVEVQDEQALLQFIQWLATSLADRINSDKESRHRVLPKVKAAALMYLKRYFLQHSTLEGEALPVLLYCLFLAGKIENAFVPVDALLEASGHKKLSAQDVLKLEFPVLEALQYDLIVHTPHRAIRGFIQDIERCQREDPDALGTELAAAVPGVLSKVQEKALGAADVLMRTDAPLVFPPGQLALAAVRSGCRDSRISLARYVQQVAAQQARQQSAGASGEQLASDLVAALDSIDKYGALGSNMPGEDQLKGIQRALKKWYTLASAAAAQQDAHSEAERGQRREAKLRERAQAREAAEQRLLQGS